MKKSNKFYALDESITIDGINYSDYVVKRIPAKKATWIEFVAASGNTVNIYDFKTVKDAFEYVASLASGNYKLGLNCLISASDIENAASRLEAVENSNTTAATADDTNAADDNADDDGNTDYMTQYFNHCKKALESTDTTVLIPVMSSQLDSYRLERIDCIFDKYVNPIESARIEFKNSVVIACFEQQDAIFNTRYCNLLDRGITKTINPAGNISYIDKDGKTVKDKDVIFYENYINMWQNRYEEMSAFCLDSYATAASEADTTIPTLIASEVAGTKLPACFEYKKPGKEKHDINKPINKVIDLSIVYWKNIGSDNFAGCKKRLKAAVCDFYKTFLRHDADEIYNQFSGGCNDKMLAKIATKIEKTVRDKNSGKYKTIYSCYNNLVAEMRNIFLMQLQGAFTVQTK